MANRFVGEVSGRVGGQTYTLRLDFNALCALEDAIDKNSMDVLDAIEKGEARVSEMRAFTHAAMLHHHPDATELEAGALMSECDGILVKLLAAAYPTKEEVKDLQAPAGNRKAARKPRVSTS